MKHVKLFEGFLNEHFETGSPNVHLKPGHLSPSEERVLNSLKEQGFINLGDDIYSVLGPHTKIELFSSGYFGLHILHNGHEFYIMDQPGKVGLEDQEMPYIVLKRGSSELIKVGPDYHSRGFGNVQMDPEMRKKAYEEILLYFKDEYETITSK